MNRNNRNIQTKQKKKTTRKARLTVFLRRTLMLVLAVAMILPQPCQVNGSGSIGSGVGTDAGGEIMTFTGAVGSFYANGSIDTDPGVWQGFGMADTIIMAYPEEPFTTVTLPAEIKLGPTALPNDEEDSEEDPDEEEDDLWRVSYYAFHVQNEESPDVMEFDLDEMIAAGGEVVSGKVMEDQFPGFLELISPTGSQGYDVTEDSRILFFKEETVKALFEETGSDERLTMKVPLTIRVGGETLPFNSRLTYQVSFMRFILTDEGTCSWVRRGGGGGMVLVTTPKEAIGVEVEPEKPEVTAGETVKVTIHCSNYSDMGLEETVLEIYNGDTKKRLSGQISNVAINGTPIDDSLYEITDDGRIVFDRWFSFLRMLPDNMEAERETNKNNPPFVVTFDYTTHPDDIDEELGGEAERIIPIRGVLTASTPANSFNSDQKEKLYRILYDQTGGRWNRGVVWDYTYGDPDLSTYYSTGADSSYFYVNDPLEYRVDMEEEHQATIKITGDFPEPDPDPYTVTYHANYTGAPDPDRVEFGPYVEGDTVPVQSGSLFNREGYTFLGWSGAADDETLIHSAEEIAAGGVTFEMPARDVDLYAQWEKIVDPPEPDTYQVRYHANYTGAANTPILDSNGPYTAGTTVTLKQGSLFTRSGYTFLGWSLTENGGVEYNADDVALATGRPTFEMPENDVNLYAQWEKIVDPPEPDTYQVRYHANYTGAASTPILDSNGPYTAGTTVTLKQGSLFTRSGYTFLGWSLTENGQVVYEADDVAPAVGRPVFEMPEHDVNLYAQWEEDYVEPGPDPDPTYPVRYHANYTGAASTPILDSDGPYTAGTTVTLKQGSLFTRSGYTFLGWSLTENGGVVYEADDVAPAVGRPTFEMPARDVDLYAQWEKIVDPPEPEDPPALIYHANGGVRADGSTDPYRDESLEKGEYYFVLENEDSEELGYEKEGYTFLGWHTTPDPEPDTTEGWYQEGTRITVDWDGDQDVYAIWVLRDPEIPDYLVLYNANCLPFEGSMIDGNNAYYESSTVTVQANQYFYPPDYYQFVGWNTEADGSGEWYDPDDVFSMPAHNVVLYAQWELTPFRVYYHANAASYTGSVEDSNTYVRGDEVTVMANGFARSGYTFQGWSESPGGSVTYTAAQLNAAERPTFTMPGADVHLYAQWSKDSTGGGGGGGGSSSYNVIYHSVYATKTAVDGTYNSGATVTVKEHSVFPASTIEVPAGATFLGWSDSLNGANIVYLPGDTFRMPARNVNLYAVYDLENDLLNRDDHYAYVVGYPDGTVRPSDLITREEVTTIFFRLLTDDARDQYWLQVNDFDDVRYGRWSNNAISTMQNAGIVNGYPDGSFRPEGNITRAEVAVIAAQFDSTVYNGASKFGDVSGHWAADYINRAAERGWVSGYPDGSFQPDAYITRAEMMTLVNSVLDRNPESPDDLLSDMVRWPDNTNPSSWYYLQVQEATNSHYYERYAGGDGHTAGAEYWTQIRPVRDWAALEQRQ